MMASQNSNREKDKRKNNNKSSKDKKEQKNKNPENKEKEKQPANKVGWKIYGSIGGQQHAKLATTYTPKKNFPEIGKNQCEYRIVDGFLDPGSDTFRLGGYARAVENPTKRKVTVVGYNGDTVKENTPIGTWLTAIDLPDDTTIIVRAI